MRNIAIVINNEDPSVDPLATIDLVRKAGFKNVFIQWYDDSLECSQQEQLDRIKKLDLKIIFAHLGYQNINSIWENDSTGDKLVDRYKNDIRICGENGIPMVIMHLTSKSVAPAFNKLGLARIKEIVNYAESLNIKVAFENNKIKGYLEYVLDNIDNKNTGICYDSGHCHAYFNDNFDYLKFKNRIFAVHLHDNDTTDDLHLIPFDGTIDWEMVVKNLKGANYKGPVTLESCYGQDYLAMTQLEFYKKCLQAGEKLADMFID
jgi:sugar phosphate isomerase/epimerase